MLWKRYQAVDNPDGVAALIERFLLARREQMALQETKTTPKTIKLGIGSSSSAASGAELKGQAPTAPLCKLLYNLG